MDPWERLWQRLTVTERCEAAYEYLASVEQFPEARAGAIRAVAAAERTRVETVERWSLEKRSESVGRGRGLPGPLLQEFIICFHVKRRVPMITRFLDAAGIAHVNCVIDTRTVLAPARVESLVQGIRAIRADFSEREVDIYLDAVQIQGGIFRRLAEARALAHRPERPAEDRPRPDSRAAPPARIPLGDPPPDYVVAASERVATIRSKPTLEPLAVFLPDPYLSDAERLSALDELLRDGLLAAIGGIEGALPKERLRPMVDELLRLNAARHRSHYHLGFLDVLEGRVPDPDTAAASERHRGWYLCGAVHALSRRGDGAGIVALLDRHSNDVRRILGDRHESCADAVFPLVEALLAGGRRADAVQGLVPTAVARAGRPLMDLLLDDAVANLRAGRAVEALQVVTLLLSACEAAERRRTPADPAFLEQVRRRQAIALRLQGGYDAARNVLDRLVGSADPATAASARADLGLVEARVRSLSEVRLPARAEDLPAAARALAAGEAAFQKVAEDAPARGPADVCQGTLLFARGEVERALPYLERAVAWSSAGGVLDEGHGVEARARLALGVALAESLDAGRAAEASDHVVAATRALPSEAHTYLIARALAGLAATRPDLAAETMRALHDVLGDRLLDAALDAGLLPAHATLREALAHRCADSHRSRRVRGADAEGLLRDALRAGDVARAERALVVLEDLADDAEGRQRMLAVLSDRARYDPAWGAEEALYARVRLLEAEGRYAEAASLLCGAGHEVLSRDPGRGPAMAEDLLARIEGYGVECPDASLLARVAALRRSEAVPPAAPAHVPAGRVYFVGGNEVQEQYEPWLRAEIARRWPRVDVEFDFRGWSSNWGRDLSTIESHVGRSGAVVIMRFVRTMLGRTVRALCSSHGKPWVACTGHGRQSLLSAIERAVALLP